MTAPTSAELVERVREALSYYSAGLALGPATSRRLDRALVALSDLAARLEAAERAGEVARIQGLAPDDARRYMTARDEWADRYQAAADRAERAEAERDEARAEARRNWATAAGGVHYAATLQESAPEEKP